MRNNYFKSCIGILFMLLLVVSSSRSNAQTTVTIGTNDGTNTTTDYPCPLQDWYYGSRAQFLYTATELASMGITSGATITEIGWVVIATIISGHLQENYSISLLNTSVTTLNLGTWEAGATLVYGPVNYAYVSGYAGNQMFTTNPFTFAGGNLIVEVCGGLSTGGFTNNPSCEWSTGLAFDASHQWRQDLADGCPNTDPTNYATSTNRPRLVVTYLAGGPCSGVPTPGNTLSSSNPVCLATNFTLSTQNITIGTGVTYQWQSSPDGVTWTNIAAGTNLTYTTSQANTTYYQCIVTCSGGGTGTSTPLQVVTGSCYNMCSGGTNVTITDTMGTFFDSGGPTGSYQASELCTVLIAPSCAVSIVMTFSAFDCETNFDTLYIYDGQTTAAPLLGSFTGQTIPPAVTATSGYMLCRFKSDPSVNFTGWAASWVATTVVPIAPIADIGINDYNPPLNAGVHFTDLSTGGPTNWIWDFGDGDTAMSQNPIHAFAAAGTYYITLYSFVCWASDTAYDTLTVQQSPFIVVYPDTLSATVNCGDSAVFQLIVLNQSGGECVYNTSGSANSQVNMLALSYGTDLFSEFQYTINAINQYFTNYTLTTYNDTNAAVIGNLLVGKNVLLIPEIEGALPRIFNNYTGVFNNFLLSGGTIIQCGATEGLDSCLTTTGLWSKQSGTLVEDIGGGFTTVSVDSLSHPLMAGVSGSSFTAPSATYVMDFTNTDKHTLVSYGGNDVVSFRNVGSGKVVYIGFDYWTTNADANHIIANAVESAQQSGLPSWITLSQTTDTVASPDSSIITVVFHATGIPAGTYYGTIGVTTNDTLLPFQAVACTMTVVGDPIIALSDTCIDFGEIIENTSSSVTFDVINDGCDSLIISNFFPSLPEFTVTAPLYIILPGASVPVTVTFAPADTGIFNASILIQNNDNDTTICITAAAGPAPVIVTADTIAQFVPACNGVDSTTFTIYNTGGSDLNYNITGIPSWAVLSVTSGTIIEGDSIVITVVMSSGLIAGGIQSTNINIASNDPVTPNLFVNLRMDVGLNPCFTINGSIDACTGIGTFTNTPIVNPPTSWTWYFGDGDSSTAASPIHQYSAPQGTTFNVMAIGCTAGGCDTQYVTLTMPLVTGPAAALCLPQTQDPGTAATLGIGIVDVDLVHISNASNNSIDGYSNFTCNDTTSLKAGDSYYFSVITGQTYEETVKAWIDFNNDGGFDPAELVFSDSAILYSHIGVLTVPITASIQFTALRFRIESEYSGATVQPDGCSDMLYGQCEDYTVFINDSVFLEVGHTVSDVIFNVYPNPTSKVATIDYVLLSTQNVSVEVFNLVGDKVQEFAMDEQQSMGKHSYKFNQSTPGIYFVKLTIDGVSKTQKLVNIQ